MEKKPCVVLFEQFVGMELLCDVDVKVGTMKKKDFKEIKSTFFVLYNNITGASNVVGGKHLSDKLQALGEVDDLYLYQVIEAMNATVLDLAAHAVFKKIELGSTLFEDVLIGTPEEIADKRLKFQLGVVSYVVDLKVADILGLLNGGEYYTWHMFNALMTGAKAVELTASQIYFSHISSLYKFVDNYSPERLFDYLANNFMMCNDAIPNLCSSGYDPSRLWDNTFIGSEGKIVYGEVPTVEEVVSELTVPEANTTEEVVEQ